MYKDTVCTFHVQLGPTFVGHALQAVSANIYQ